MYVLILVQFLPLFSPSLHRPLVFLALSAPVSGIYVRLGMRSSAPLFPSPAWSPRALNCLLRSPFAASSTPAPSAYVVVLQQQEHRPQTNATRKNRLLRSFPDQTEPDWISGESLAFGQPHTLGSTVRTYNFHFPIGVIATFFTVIFDFLTSLRGRPSFTKP